MRIIRVIVASVMVLCLSGVVVWSSTQNYLQKWNGSANVDSAVYENGGNVGIGTTSPGYPLHVFSTGANLAKLETNSSGGPYLAFAASGVEKGYVGADGGALISGASQNDITLRSNAGQLRFATGPAFSDRMVIDANGTVHMFGDLAVTGNIAAKYQDVAEWVQARNRLASGTVVVIDHDEPNVVESSRRSYDTGVAGVVSAQPGLTLGEKGNGKVLVAQSGRVRVKVDASYGAVRNGDLLVTSPTPGYAMRSQSIEMGSVKIHRPGTLLGKALEPLANGQGQILVLLTLQ